MRPPAPTKDRSAALARRGRGVPLPAAVFFALFFLYVWLRIEPVLEYQRSGPVFFLSRSFFRPFLNYPGGLLEYATAFLAQLNYSNGLGALVFTVSGGLIFLAGRRVLRRFSATTPELASDLAAFTPLFLLLLVRERYDSVSLAVSTDLLLGLALALGYLSLPGVRAGWRLVACWLGAALLFYLAGLWPCVLFVLLAALFEGLRQRHWLLGLGCALSAGAAPFGIGFFPDAEPARILVPWGEAKSVALAAALYLFFPLASVVLALLSRSAATAPSAIPERRESSSAVHRRWGQTVGARRAGVLALFCLGWTWVWLGLDGGRKGQAQIEYYTGRQEYDKALAVAAGLQPMDAASETSLHLALYHTGRLPQDLFSFTNQTAGELLPGLGAGLDSCRAQSQTLLELGLVSDAEHLAHEALEWDGDRPDLLRRLAQVNVLKDRPNAARVFLNRLDQVPFQRAEAERCLRDLEANPRLPDNPALTQIRSRMVTNDLAHEGLPATALLRHLLRYNSTNRMAFEYLMTGYLLAGEVDKVVEGLGQLDAFGYAGVPRHFEEAALLFQRLKGVQVVLRGRQIRPETVQRFQRFSDAMNRRAYETVEGRLALARDFGDTFWYHYYSSQTAPRKTSDRPAGS